ncbi:XK-related protein 8-like [Colossoma macropomum]|uniref:XK-related protein 8-like n=1 Tax=Colossoma macropomum TaxID=42526 RepID=UPI00186404BB|nr:XK-related protein 8-like [Colossoma macropomum]
MEETFPFHFPLSSSLLSLLSTLLFLLDVALDVWAIVSLYQDGEYVYMGVLIALLLCSSILVHVFSWIWYSEPETSTDKFAREYGLIGPLHVFQLGLFLRFASLIEISIRKIIQRSDRFQEGVAVFLKHDLSVLRLFETFSESVPQLVLMITFTMHEQELQLFTAFKIAGSLVSIAISVLFYHRDMRDFVPEDQKMGWSSSAVFFLWNLFLITPRVLAVALFASILPCYIAAHFLSWWVLLFLCAWRQKTDFMDTEGGEWLYRATVGLIWYFSWFNVSKGKTKVKSIIYHVCMGADIGLLLGLWFWKRSVESARLNPLPVNPYILIGALPALYITGLLLKLLYYWNFHPNCPSLRFGDRDETPRPKLCSIGAAANVLVETDSADEGRRTGVDKRMRNMAANFYY